VKARASRALALLRGFFRASDGAFSVLTAILSVVIIGFTGLVVDLGSAVYWQRRLQASTDSAALAATFDLTRSASIAAADLQANGPSAAVIAESAVGSYVDDPSVAEEDRFVAGAADNAVSLTTQYTLPVYFMRLFTGATDFPLQAKSIAYNLPLAGVGIGTAVAGSDANEFNAFMETQSGDTYDLTQQERDALNQTPIAIFRLFDKLAAASGNSGSSIETVLASSVDLATLANGAAAALSESAPTPTATQTTAMAALTHIAQGAGSSPSVTVRDFLSLTAHQKRSAGDLVSKTTDALGVPALTMLIGYLQMSRQNTLVNENHSFTVPGLATIDVESVLAKSAIGGAARGIAMVGPKGASAYASQGRVRLTITLLQPIQLDVGLVHLSLPVTIPLIADLGYGSAAISAISCGSDVPSTTDIAVTAQSGAVHLYIGSVTNNQLTDLLTPLVPSPAQIVNIPLVKVGGQSAADIASSAVQTLHFDWNDIVNGTEKSPEGSPSVTDALDELSENLALTVNQAPVGTGAIILGLVRPQVSAVLAALEPELESVLASLGLEAGTMNVRASAVRCGIPALVM